MAVLPDINAHLIRPLQDIEPLSDDSGIQPQVLYQRVPGASNAVLSAALAANKTVLQNYNPAIPENRQQGVISAVYQLQSLLADFTGYASISLSSFNARMAIIACLSMVLKRHQKNKQQRKHIVLLKRLTEVAAVAEQMGLQVKFSDLENVTDYVNDECFAVVTSLPGLSDKQDVLQRLRSELEQLEIPLCIDGSGQYLLTEQKTIEWLQADILLLDVAAICGLNKGVNAVLANQLYAELLPLPIAACSEGVYRWSKLEDKPFSIGMLSTTPVNLHAIMHCLAYFRMQGFTAIGQQAVQSMVMARYLQQQLSQHGIQCEDVFESCGRCVLTLERLAVQTRMIELLMRTLNDFPISLQTLTFDNTLKLTLGNLHVLSFDQLQQLVEMFILRQDN